ncbi:hypothetical protein SteCoe_16792 [Stentor coeruleus]|uniref:Tubulin-tyrosine ligase family protein n=1 Tax=Stentor coeruleus TaxID=5963 RepID=A0A1R2C0P6_9CILI|nr:hypothetical protein SteCoe_16792 [Stentor coeruleus]
MFQTRHRHNIRHSLDLTSSLKSFKKPLKTAQKNASQENHNKTSLLPCFRPKSPLSRLPHSLQITRISIIKPQPYDKSNKSINSRSTTAFNRPNKPLFDLTNPQTPIKSSLFITRKSEVPKTTIILTKKPSKQLELYSLKSVKKVQKLEKLSIKDIKDRRWLSSKRGTIIKDFYITLTKSNGMKIQHNEDLLTSYKYYVGKGNNSKLIKHLMSQRQGWTRVKFREIQTANFIWNEWIDNTILHYLQVSEKIECIFEPLPKACIYHYCPNFSKRFIVDTSPLGFGRISNSTSFRQIKPTTYQSSKLKVYNKIAGNHNLSNKKDLFFNLQRFCSDKKISLINYIPTTFHITSLKDPNFSEFEKYFRINHHKIGHIWILKPGEDTNRGNGISICTSLEQIKREISRSLHTIIIQKYIENPFLVYKRKFDIRCYALITCFNGILQGYYYNEGYIRTSSKNFSLQNIDNLYIHLTNDAIQKSCEDYGKYESGNKMSYAEMQKYLDVNYSERNFNFVEEVGGRIKEIVADTIKCAACRIEKKMYNCTFEVFGYDFLLDEDLKPWLLEVNTNPCLEISSSHLARIIPSMIDNALQITIDSLFQVNFSLKNDMPAVTENRFELVYHSLE